MARATGPLAAQSPPHSGPCSARRGCRAVDPSPAPPPRTPGQPTETHRGARRVFWKFIPLVWKRQCPKKLTSKGKMMTQLKKLKESFYQRQDIPRIHSGFSTRDRTSHEFTQASLPETGHRTNSLRLLYQRQDIPRIHSGFSTRDRTSHEFTQASLPETGHPHEFTQASL